MLTIATSAVNTFLSVTDSLKGIGTDTASGVCSALSVVMVGKSKIMILKLKGREA